MITLFTEGVLTTSTNSGHNTLYVESFEEVFFGVYEFELNGSSVITEEVAKFNGSPVITIPVVKDGVSSEAPFVLKQGPQGAVLHEKKTILAENIVANKVERTVNDPEPVATNSDHNTLYVESFEEVFFGVYEFELNGSSVITEEVAKFNGSPVITIPVVKDGVSSEAPFVLKQGPQGAVLHEKKTILAENIVANKVERTVNDPEPVVESVIVEESVIVNEVEPNIINAGDKSDIIREIKESLGVDRESIIESLTADSGKHLQEAVKRDLAKNFSGEMQQIKRMVASYGGGGGTNAVQYARGGVMNGNLNIEGSILSGGIDVGSLIGIGDGGSDVSTLSGDWENTYTTVAANSATWGIDTGSDVSTLSSVWEDTYTTVQSYSAAWGTVDGVGVTAVTGGDGIDSTGGDTPELTVDATVVRTTGDQTIGGNKTFSGNTVIQGDLSVTGDFTSIDTTVSVTSALSVTNHGTGPAIYAEQAGVGQPIAKFVDSEGGISIFDDGGRLGVGNDAPTEALDVTGKIAVCGVTAVYIPHLSANYIGSSFYGDGGGLMSGFLPAHSINNTGVGVGALYENLQGANNTAVGTDALASNTYGYNNAATGYAALSANTTGCNNTAGGSFALHSNTTGCNNTATGTYSLSSNKTGRDNVAIGVCTLTDNINGCCNVALGNCALYLNTSGKDNTATGQRALYSNTDGCSNTADGAFTLLLNTSGDYNTATGHTALQTNSTGGCNTATGGGALGSNTGSFNTAHGFGALATNAAGFSNTAAGVDAGRYIADGTTANTTTVRSTFIGSNTKASASGVTNETVIGYDAIGSGTNSVTIGSSLVTKTILNGDVGIGTDAPNEALTVSGNISASGTVRSTNIDTLTNNVSALYSYLVQNFESNTITIASNISDFVSNYPKTGIVTGDVVTLSATNQVYILSDNDGSDLSDWLEVNLKPNTLFYKQGIVDYSVVDTLPLSSVNSTKYIVEVQDKSDGAIFYSEINVVSDGVIAVATEYALNHTTIFPFVEFGANVVSGTHIQLSAVALEGKDMTDFVFKGNRSNLFG